MDVDGMVTISDRSTGSTARILPGSGFNCFSFVAAIDGAEIETLWREPDFGPGSRASRSGIPLLFPFPGRLAGDSFRFDGRTFTVTGAPVNGGNPIHGFVLDRPWRIAERSADRVAATFRASVDEPALLAQWPADFQITISYEVAGSSLRSVVLIENPGSSPLPFGFGTHPYFRLPLGGPSADDCRITVPARSFWELRDMLPTGVILPVDPARDLQTPRPYRDLTADDVLTDLTPSDDGDIRTKIHDPHSGRTLTQTFDASFTECVVFTPAHREAVAIEPYTTVPDAFRLSGSGVPTGLRVLAPSASFQAGIKITLS